MNFKSLFHNLTPEDEYRIALNKINRCIAINERDPKIYTVASNIIAFFASVFANFGVLAYHLTSGGGESMRRSIGAFGDGVTFFFRDVWMSVFNLVSLVGGAKTNVGKYLTAGITYIIFIALFPAVVAFIVKITVEAIPVNYESNDVLKNYYAETYARLKVYRYDGTGSFKPGLLSSVGLLFAFILYALIASGMMTLPIFLFYLIDLAMFVFIYIFPFRFLFYPTTSLLKISKSDIINLNGMKYFEKTYAEIDPEFKVSER